MNVLWALPEYVEVIGGWCSPDRQDFIRENAVAVVNKLKSKTMRQAKELCRLDAQVKSLRAELKRVRNTDVGT